MAANQAGKPTNSMPENLQFYAPRQYFFRKIVGDNFLHDQTMYLVRKGWIQTFSMQISNLDFLE